MFILCIMDDNKYIRYFNKRTGQYENTGIPRPEYYQPSGCANFKKMYNSEYRHNSQDRITLEHYCCCAKPS